MNRCELVLPNRMRRLALLTLLSLGFGATAQTNNVREFPKTALRGNLSIVSPPEILLDGKADRLSPGSRIRGTNNLMLLSGGLIGQTLVVNYTREAQGMVHDVWILTPDEADLPRERAATP